MRWSSQQIEAIINVLLMFQGSRIEDEPTEDLAAEALELLEASGFHLVPINPDVILPT